MDELYCPVCDGPAYPLGQLGSLVHCRCRNCGAQFSHKAQPVEATPPVEHCYDCGEQLEDDETFICDECRAFNEANEEIES